MELGNGINYLLSAHQQGWGFPMEIQVASHDLLIDPVPHGMHE